ncbi:MAG: hypothetical protein JSR48_12190 [Verrucomicrobia bacterium]|nr:hypothetical protein [Verrucomicrobiota bacterium]
MDSVPPASRPARPPLAGLVLAVALVAYGWFIYQDGAPYAGGADSSGYLNSARLLASGRLTDRVRTVPGLDPPAWNTFFHQPLGYAVKPGQTEMVPIYPVGLPLHYVVGAWFVGFEKTARVVNALASVAAGLLLFGLARRVGLGAGWAAVAVALLWCCPIWIFHALQPLSDCVATAWVLAAVLAAWHAADRPRWAVPAGAALGIAVLVRPTSLLALIPLAVLLPRTGRHWRHLVLGGLPAAVFLGWYNATLYGGVLQTGYSQGGSDLWSAFGREFVAVNLAFFAAWIPRVLSWPVVLLAVLGLAWLWPGQRRLAVALLLWIAAFLAFYTPYFCAGESWGYLRFLLPAFPPVILAALLAAQRLAAALPRTARRLAPALVVLGTASFQLALADELHLTDIRSGERNYWVAARWIRDHVPADAIVLAMQMSGAITYYDPQPIVRWDQITPAQFALLRQAEAARHQPLWAALFPFEQRQLKERFGGTWRVEGREGPVEFWRLEVPAAP